MKLFAFPVVLIFLLALTVQSVFSQAGTPPRRTFLDFSGDKRTDLVLVRNNGGNLLWKILRNQDTTPDVTTIFQYGLASDQITPGDYFGSQKIEISVYRNAAFYDALFVDNSPPTQITAPTYWGQSGDWATYVGDYDGDKNDDHTVLRYVSGNFYWYINGSAGINRTIQFGTTFSGYYNFAFRGADYNGDGRDELVMAYVDSATNNVIWHFGDSTNGSIMAVHQFGNYRTDKLLPPADYTGDKKADLMIWKCKAEYYVGMGDWRLFAPQKTAPQNYYTIDRGTPQYDVPLSGDYDGDGITDLAWYRPSTSTFSWSPSSQRWYPSTEVMHIYGPGISRTFGLSGDTPVAGLGIY